MNRSSIRKNLLSGLLLVMALITLTISTQSLAGFPERIGLSALSLIQRGFNTTRNFVANTVTSISELKKLEYNYHMLLERVEHLGNLERNYSEIRKENDRLKELLAFSQESQYTSIASRIIAKDPENLYSTIILDKGSNDGVIKNQAVIAYQDGIEGLVGRVVEVGRDSCIVSPLYDSSAYVAVRLERSRYDGLASGSGTDNDPIVIKYIKKRARDEIQYGDLIITSGLQSIFPAGIAVARVINLRDLDYLTSLELDAEPVIDFGKIEYVFILNILKNYDEFSFGVRN